jgi:4,5-DOPA dioxygenase extradiol
MPALFVSHGAPDEALKDSGWSRALAEFGRRWRPRAIVAVSGHWVEQSPVRVTAWREAETLHDFTGFPPELYRIKYPVPGDPELAARIVDRLSEVGIEALADSSRPLDHGVWVPLLFLHPAADVPVVEISQPLSAAPETLLSMGRALAPLRRQGVLFLATGGLVHNLRRVRVDRSDAPVDLWAREFEDWVLERLEARDEKSLLSYRSAAPSVSLAAPTPEHFDPLFFFLGAAFPDDRSESVYAGFEYGNLSMRTVAWLSPED